MVHKKFTFHESEVRRWERRRARAAVTPREAPVRPSSSFALPSTAPAAGGTWPRLPQPPNLHPLWTERAAPHGRDGAAGEPEHPGVPREVESTV